MEPNPGASGTVLRGSGTVNIRVLGCHGSEQIVGEESGSVQCRTCGFLINDALLLDAGTIGTALTLSEQKRIRHILLSHLHFDHIQGLPTLADNLVDDAAEPVEIVSIAHVLAGLHTHIFNDVVYPNFFTLPTPQRPIFVCRTVETGTLCRLSGLEVTAVPVNHLVPSVGFLIRDGPSSIVYSGDTGVTDEIWAAAIREPTLKAVFIETAFPDEMADLAAASRHLTPALFATAFRKIGRPDLPVFAYHLKPRHRAAIRSQLIGLGIAHLAFLEEGQELII